MGTSAVVPGPAGPVDAPLLVDASAAAPEDESLLEGESPLEDESLVGEPLLVDETLLVDGSLVDASPPVSVDEPVLASCVGSQVCESSEHVASVPQSESTVQPGAHCESMHTCPPGQSVGESHGSGEQPASSTLKLRVYSTPPWVRLRVQVPGAALAGSAYVVSLRTLRLLGSICSKGANTG